MLLALLQTWERPPPMSVFQLRMSFLLMGIRQVHPHLLMPGQMFKAILAMPMYGATSPLTFKEILQAS